MNETEASEGLVFKINRVVHKLGRTLNLFTKNTTKWMAGTHFNFHTRNIYKQKMRGNCFTLTIKKQNCFTFVLQEVTNCNISGNIKKGLLC